MAKSAHPTPPISEARLAANRANAKKSTGPRTAEGKAASSRNAVKHGFRASAFAVVRLEDLDEIANLKADAIAFYAPTNSQELFAVERIAIAQQMIFRAGRLEAGLFTTAMNEAVNRLNKPIQPMDEALIGNHDIKICQAQNRHYALGTGVRRMAAESNIWGLMLRYRTQADREYRRALEDLDRLKALRDTLPNEPTELLQPEHSPELADPHDLNFRVPKKPETPAEPATEPAAQPVAAAKPVSTTPERPETTPNPPSEPRPKAA